MKNCKHACRISALNNFYWQNTIYREKTRKSVKARDGYGLVFDRVLKAAQEKKNTSATNGAIEAPDKLLAITDGSNNNSATGSESCLVPANNTNKNSSEGNFSNSLVSAAGMRSGTNSSNIQLIPKKAPSIPKPAWHAPWKLSRVISGHLGWVRSIAVEPGKTFVLILNKSY